MVRLLFLLTTRPQRNLGQVVSRQPHHRTFKERLRYAGGERNAPQEVVGGEEKEKFERARKASEKQLLKE
jgi:hypothetical protein